MNLTKKQQEFILKMTKENDYCGKGNRKIMNNLEKLDLVKSSNGFGFKFGGIVELTDKGKEIHNKFQNLLNI